MSTTKDNRIVEPYLFFNGRCEEAIEFYRTALGAQVDMIMRYKESPEPPKPGMLPPGFENKIMHTSFRIGQTTVMASDGCFAGKSNFDGFSLALSVPDEAEADRVFVALSKGGQVKMPLAKTFWSPRFGMLEDQFGIGWMVSVRPAGQK
jgi:PhnB protein